MRFVVLAAAASFLLSPAARAEVPRPIFSGSAGALFTAGGDLWTAPESSFDLDAIPFGDTAGGFGVGGGVFFEARLIRYIGVELGLLFEHDRMWYDLEYTDTTTGVRAEFRYILKYTDVRLPLLFKGVFDTKALRIGIGIGPEFVFSRSAAVEIEELSDWGVDTSIAEENYRAKEQSDVFLCVGLDLAFKVWKLSIPLKIRYSFNTSQPEDDDGRLGYSPPDDFKLVASQSMDLRILLGLAYDF